MIKAVVHEHEQLGRMVTKIITEYVAQLDSCRVTPEATPGDLEKLFDEPLPEAGATIERILERFTRDIAPNAMKVPSPRYFGQFNPTPLPIGVWADALCSALNQNAGAWRNGPTSAMIEARVMRWLCELVGYDNESFGTLASGGSEANLIAFSKFEVCRIYITIYKMHKTIWLDTFNLHEDAMYFGIFVNGFTASIIINRINNISKIRFVFIVPINKYEIRFMKIINIKIINAVNIEKL